MRQLLLATIISTSFSVVDAMNSMEEIQLLKRQLAQQQSRISSLTEQNALLLSRSPTKSTLSRTNSTTSICSFATTATGGNTISNAILLERISSLESKIESMKTSNTQLKAQVREANSRAEETTRRAQEQSAKEAAERERIKQEAHDDSRRAEEAHRRALERSTKASDEREQAKLKDAAQKHAKEMRRKDEDYRAGIARLQKIATDELNRRKIAEFNWRVCCEKNQSLWGQLSASRSEAQSLWSQLSAEQSERMQAEQDEAILMMFYGRLRSDLTSTKIIMLS